VHACANPVQHPCRIRAARSVLAFFSASNPSRDLDLHKIGPGGRFDLASLWAVGRDISLTHSAGAPMHERLFSGFHTFVSPFHKEIQLWCRPVHDRARPVQHQCCTKVLDSFSQKYKLRADR
jgi:hypothetical protein